MQAYNPLSMGGILVQRKNLRLKRKEHSRESHEGRTNPDKIPGPPAGFSYTPLLPSTLGVIHLRHASTILYFVKEAQAGACGIDSVC